MTLTNESLDTATAHASGLNLSGNTIYSQKRKHDKLSPEVSEHQKKYIFEAPTLLSQNKFYIPKNLENQLNPQSSENTGSLKNKIPPIYVHNATNYKNIIEDIRSVLPDSDFTTQCKSDSLRINLTNSTDFRKLTEFYDQKDIQYHTFLNPDNSLLSVIIRNIPLSIPVEEIKEVLSKSYPVKKVTRLFNKEKYPMPLCVVDLEKDGNANEIFNLTKFDHSIISVEPRRKSKDIPQCTRCQRFGHTKNYCRLQPRCVKCTESHHYSECPKRAGESPSCVNCGGNHTANFRGCPFFTDLKSRINNQQRRKTQSTVIGNQSAHASQQIPPSSSSRSPNPTQPKPNTRSYADAIKNNQDPLSNIVETIISMITPYLDQIKQFICSLFTSMFNGSSFQR